MSVSVETSSTLALDHLPGVAERLAVDHRLPPERARRAVNEMLKFLWACHETEDLLVPSPQVDEAWHTFILDTRAYHDYCLTTFGTLIHHRPGVTGDSEDAYQRTRDIIEDRFGIDTELWPTAGADCGRCGGAR